jgi:hypothetical protein
MSIVVVLMALGFGLPPTLRRARLKENSAPECVAISTARNVPHHAVVDVRRPTLAIGHIGSNDTLNAERLADLICGVEGLIRVAFSLKVNTVTVRDATVMAVAARAF